MNHSAPLSQNEQKAVASPSGRRCTQWTRRCPGRNFISCSFNLLIKIVELRAESELENQFQYSYNKSKLETFDLRGPFSAFFSGVCQWIPRGGRKNSGNNQHFSRIFADRLDSVSANFGERAHEFQGAQSQRCSTFLTKRKRIQVMHTLQKI